MLKEFLKTKGRDEVLNMSIASIISAFVSVLSFSDFRIYIFAF